MHIIMSLTQTVCGAHYAHNYESDSNSLSILSDILCTLGTGKSETGAHIAYTLAMSNRMRQLDGCVLYCAPTNKAVDVVLSKFCKLC